MQRFVSRAAASLKVSRALTSRASASVVGVAAASLSCPQRRFFTVTPSPRLCSNNATTAATTATSEEAVSGSEKELPAKINFEDLMRNLVNQPLSSRVQIGDQNLSVLEILTMSLQADCGGGVAGHQKSEMWYMCGLVLSHASAGGDAVDSHTVPFNGKEYTARECFIKAVEVSPTNSIAWNNLGASLEFDEFISIPKTGDKVDRIACFQRAVRFDEKNDRAWFNLGSNMQQPSIECEDSSGTPHLYSRKDCFLKALAVNVSNSNCWYNLGVTLGGVEEVKLNGERFNSQQCFVKAIELEPRNVGAWNYLGATIPETTTVVISGEAYSPRQCFAKAIELDPSSPAAAVAWNNIATTLQPGEHAAIAGKAFSNIQCYAKAVECDCTDAKAWQRLGITMEPGMKVTIYGQEMSQQDCFVKAIECDDEDGMAWHNAGATIRNRGDTVVIRGKARTQRECFIKAIERDANNSIAWYVVGTSLNPAVGETCSVLGKPYTALECFIKTVSVDPTNSLMWNNLAAAIPKGTMVEVELTEVKEEGDAAEGDVRTTQIVHKIKCGRRECLIKAIELDPTHTNAWYNLSVTMEEGETVALFDKMFTKAECLQRGTLNDGKPTLSSYH